MHPATIVAAFATIFVAELPDKTMLATIVLSARFKRPIAVWVGASLALVTQVLIATAAGRLIDLFPDRPVKLVVATMFATGGILLWRSASRDDDETEVVADSSPDVALAWTRVSVSVYSVVFLAEWGDLTQIATASLATNGRAPSVFVGASLAMVSVAALGAAAGTTLLRVLPEGLLHRVAAVIFGVLAVVFVLAAL